MNLLTTTKWRKKTEEWQTLIFPNLMYDYSDINGLLETQTGKVDPQDSDFIFTLYFDMTIFRVVLLIHEDYELDLLKEISQNCLVMKKRF